MISASTEYNYPDEYSKPSQTSKMERFAKKIDGFYPLTISAKHSILEIWLGSEYTSVT